MFNFPYKRHQTGQFEDYENKTKVIAIRNNIISLKGQCDHIDEVADYYENLDRHDVPTYDDCREQIELLTQTKGILKQTIKSIEKLRDKLQ